MEPDSALIFLHVPKTAGTSLFYMLSAQYPLGTMAFIYGIEDRRRIEALPDSVKRKFRVIAGHQAAGIHTSLPQNSICFTILREPIARFVSLYHHLQRQRVEPYRSVPFKVFLHQLMQERDDTLLQFDHMLGNYQVLYLDPVFAVHQKQNQDVLSYIPDLEKTISFIDSHCLAVGIQERFSESLMLLGHIMGWSHLKTLRINTGPKGYQPALSHEERHFLERYLALDYQLYGYVNDKLDQQLQAYHIGQDNGERYLRSAGLLTLLQNALSYQLQRWLFRQTLRQASR